MKTQIIAAAVMGMSLGAFAQGTVSFNNNSPAQPAVTLDKSSANGGAYAPANGFTVALYWVNQSSGPFAPINLLTATPVKTFTGQFNGGFDAGTVTIAGQTAGGTGEFEVAGWLGTYTSYAEANILDAGGASATAPFYNATGGDGTPAGVPKELTGWAEQPDLVLYTAFIPEPGTLAIGGMGAAALLLFRRRKRGENMKTRLLATAMTGLSLGAFAQGTVSFNNNAANQPAITVDKPFASGGTYAPANGFMVALYWVNQSSGPFAPINLLTATPVKTAVGQFNGGFDAGTVVIAGQAAGGTGEFEVAGWLGTTYTSYAAAYYGDDKAANGTPFYNSTGGDGTPASVPKNLTGWAGQADIALIDTLTPEPSTIAIGGLGAVAVVLFRRRRRVRG